jgi:large subunit ribosomal protein L21
MFAIVRHGGHQYRVSPGDRVVVDRVSADPGTIVALEPVLLIVADDGGLLTGDDGASGARVAASVVTHRRGRKIRVFTYKAKKRHRRTLGYRSELTELRVEAIVPRGEPLPPPSTVVPEPQKVEEQPAPSPRGRRGKAETTAQPAPATATTPAGEKEAPSGRAPRRAAPKGSAEPAHDATSASGRVSRAKKEQAGSGQKPTTEERPARARKQPPKPKE